MFDYFSTNGFAKTETLSWEAYNESTDSITHVETYKKLRGIISSWSRSIKFTAQTKTAIGAAKRGIGMTVAKKGKQPELTNYQKGKRKREFNKRSQIEENLGQARQDYGFNNIKIKLKDTSHSWIGTILFVSNLIKFAELHDFYF